MTERQIFSPVYTLRLRACAESRSPVVAAMSSDDEVQFFLPPLMTATPIGLETWLAAPD